MKSVTEIGQLAAEGRMRRREFLRRAAMLGISLPIANIAFSAITARSGARAQEAARDLEELGPIIKAAKQEGAVSAAGNSLQAEETRAAFADAFRQYYGLPSSFQVEMLQKSGGPLQKQIEEELAADRVFTDVIYLNVIPWAVSLLERGELLEFDAPTYEAYAHQDDRPDFNRRPYFVSDPSVLGSIAWNTDIIKDNQFESWFDVLRPEYEGKITCLSARLLGSWALTYMGMRQAPEIGDRFFDELGKLRPVANQSTEANVAKVISGEYPITVAAATRPYAAWKLQGVQHIAQSYPREGVVPLSVSWFGLAKAPHPNAAKLLLNFARSREGQELVVNYEGRTSGRTDVTSPNPMFAPSMQDLNLIYIDQLGVTPEDFRALGEDWVGIFGV